MKVYDSASANLLMKHHLNIGFPRGVEEVSNYVKIKYHVVVGDLKRLTWQRKVSYSQAWVF
jgi:hypothetical protein